MELHKIILIIVSILTLLIGIYTVVSSTSIVNDSFEDQLNTQAFSLSTKLKICYIVIGLAFTSIGIALLYLIINSL